MEMRPISTLLTIDHPFDPTLGYVVLEGAGKQFWYRLDYEYDTWEYLPPLDVIEDHAALPSDDG